MAKDLRDYRREIKTALSAGDLATEILDPEIDRAVELASNVLSRYFPREQVAQTVYNENITDELWTPVVDTDVTLANKPIRFASENVEKSYTAEILGDSPVAYWRLNETSGTFADSSTNSNTGTGTNVTHKIAGLISINSTDFAVEFDGVSGDIDAGSAAAIDDIFASGGSIEAWINPNSDGEVGSGRIVEKTGWQICVEDGLNSVIRIGFTLDRATTNGRWQTERIINAGTKYHVLLTYDSDSTANNPIIYIDGVSVTVNELTTPDGAVSSDAANNLIIGNRAADDRTFDGIIDEVALYGDIVTATEVLSHYNTATISAGFVRDTDYEIDYVNGSIKILSRGSMTTDQSLITYKLDGTMLDISSLLTKPIAVDRVDILNHEQVPVVFEGWITHGDFLMITGSGLDTQQRLIDNDHIRIYYMAQHTEPTDTASGSFPDYLDEVVEVGASGYVLVSESIQQDHLAVVDIANARLELADVAGIQTAIATALTAAGVRITSAATDLASAIAEIALANADQDKVNTGTTGPIAAATTEIALIVTLLGTGGLPLTALAKVTTHVGEAGTALALVNAELLLGNAALDLISIQLTTGTADADEHLNTGDDLINAVNVGRNAADLRRSYAIARTEIANALANQASQRYQQGQVLTQEAAQRNNMSLQFVNEANGLLRTAEAKLTLVQQRLAVGTLHQRNAEGYNTNAQRYIQSAGNHIQAASLYVREMEIKVSEINAVTTATNAHLAMAVTERQMAEQFRTEANARISDFINTLRDRSQINERPRASSVRGYSSDQASSRRFLAWERQGTF